MEGIGTRCFAQGSHTRPPQERQLCLSLASCAILLDVLAHVNRLAQQELQLTKHKLISLKEIDFFLLSQRSKDVKPYQVSSSSNGVHLGGASGATLAVLTSKRAS